MSEIMPFPENNDSTVLLDRPEGECFFAPRSMLCAVPEPVPGQSQQSLPFVGSVAVQHRIQQPPEQGPQLRTGPYAQSEQVAPVHRQLPERETAALPEGRSLQLQRLPGCTGALPTMF